MIVCIAEKPSVAQEIARVLGASDRHDGYYEGHGYQVTWTFGHLCQLKAPDSYYPSWKTWALDVLPMSPARYEVELIGKIYSHVTRSMMLGFKGLFIGNTKEERLEAKDAAVLKMGVDTPDILHTSACLGEVRIVDHQAGIIRLVVTADDDLLPKLTDNMVHQLAPVGAAIVEKLIEHIFTTTKLAA